MAAVDLLPEKKEQKVMHVVANLIFLAFAILIFVLGWEGDRTDQMLGRKSPAMEISM